MEVGQCHLMLFSETDEYDRKPNGSACKEAGICLIR
jgi:hypothetical protein